MDSTGCFHQVTARHHSQLSMMQDVGSVVMSNDCIRHLGKDSVKEAGRKRERGRGKEGEIEGGNERREE